jgi:hypothetical protein
MRKFQHARSRIPYFMMADQELPDILEVFHEDAP